MLPDWFESVPWTLLAEGGSSLGLPYSYFIKFKPEESTGYTFFITDLCTIWRESADEPVLRAKLKPYESFLELSITDLLGVLKDMLLVEKSNSGPACRFALQPAAEDDGVAVECGTQIGFVKFNWTFDCLPVDRKTAALHFRSAFILPALHLVAKSNDPVDSRQKAVSKAEWKVFTSLVQEPAAPPTSSQAIAPVELPTLNLPIPSSEPISLSVTTQPETPAASPQKPSVNSKLDAELERRKQLEELLANKAPKPTEDKKKKRKLI